MSIFIVHGLGTGSFPQILTQVVLGFLASAALFGLGTNCGIAPVLAFMLHQTLGQVGQTVLFVISFHVVGVFRLLFARPWNAFPLEKFRWGHNQVQIFHFDKSVDLPTRSVHIFQPEGVCHLLREPGQKGGIVVNEFTNDTMFEVFN